MPLQTALPQSGLLTDTANGSVELAGKHSAGRYARHYLLPLFDPPEQSPLPIDRRVCSELPIEFCRQHSVAPLGVNQECIEVAIVHPESLLLADEVRELTGKQMQPLFACQNVVQRVQQALYKVEYPETESHSESEDHTWIQRSLKQLFSPLLNGTYGCIVIEPHADGSRVCGVSDNVSTELAVWSPQLASELMSQVKQQARLDVTQHTGIIEARHGNRELTARVSFCRLERGDMLSIRSLSIGGNVAQCSDQDFVWENLKQLRCIGQVDWGVVLIAGRSSSRNSGALGSLSDKLSESRRVIRILATNEDPIEANSQSSLCDKAARAFRMRIPVGDSVADAIHKATMHCTQTVSIDEIDSSETLAAISEAAVMGPSFITSICCRHPSLVPLRLRQFGLSDTDQSMLVRKTIWID